MLPRLGTLVAAAALTVAATPLVAPPAQAAVTGSTSSADAVLKNRCVTHPVDYDLAVDPGTLFWKVKISVESPSGTSSEGVDLSSAKGSPPSGTVGFLICGSYAPGTYTVHSLGSFQILPAVNLPIQVADSAFQVRRTPTRTSVAATHLTGHRYRLVATVQDRRERGFRPTRSADVRFERLVDGVWRLIRGSRGSTDHGRVGHVVTARPGTKVRAVTAHAGYLGGSTSRARGLRP